MDAVEIIKSKIDIVDLISEYFHLKKMGRNFAALCPFHKDTKPSFMVSPDRQIFRCFSCEKKGDIFAFIQEKEGLNFRESLEFLAKKANINLPKYDKKLRDEKEKLLEINLLAAKLYHHILQNTKAGKIGRDYLALRRINPKLWEKFYLGFAPAQSILEKFLVKHGFTLAEIAQSGLLVAGGPGEYFDRFRKRLVFPIFSLSGAILGFSGRVIDEAQEPKYLNSPETPIFQKGAILYGLNLAKDAVKAAGFAILVEGEFDVISSHKVDIENVAAVKGTALTLDQIKLIKRFAEEVSICFDMDLAGDAAARRGIELADLEGLSIKVVKIAGAKDADEAVKKDPKLLELAIRSAVPVYDWLIDEAFKRFDAQAPHGAKKITDELLPFLAKISDQVVKASYFQKLAAKLRISERALWEKANIMTKKAFGKEDKVLETETLPKAVNRQQNLSEYFLALILQGAKFAKSRQNWPEVNFIYFDLINFYQEVIMSNLGKGDFDLESFAKSLSLANLAILDNLLFFNLDQALESEAVFETELKKISKNLAKIYYQEKLSKTLSEIKNLKGEGKNQKLEDDLHFLLKELSNLKKD